MTNDGIDVSSQQSLLSCGFILNSLCASVVKGFSRSRYSEFFVLSHST